MELDITQQMIDLVILLGIYRVMEPIRPLQLLEMKLRMLVFLAWDKALPEGEFPPQELPLIKAVLLN